MKDRKLVNGAPSSTSSSIKHINLNEVRVVMIRKNSIADVLLRRLRERLLLYKLRSLLPTNPSQEGRPETKVDAATEMELEPHEIPDRDSDEEDAAYTTQLSTTEEDEVVFESDDEGKEETPKTFSPTIKIRTLDDSIMIDTIVVKDISLTSELFRIFEEEKLDIVYENQYRTETRVAHTILVKLRLGYDIEALERKLCTWARKITQHS